jgi:hypothetical protein
VTDSRGGGNGAAHENGETDRDDSRVAALLEAIEGDRGESNEKFSSNMIAIFEYGLS